MRQWTVHVSYYTVARFYSLQAGIGLDDTMLTKEKHDVFVRTPSVASTRAAPAAVLAMMVMYWNCQVWKGVRNFFCVCAMFILRSANFASLPVPLMWICYTLL